MTIQLIPQTGITNGDYQLLETTFTVPATASYALGIRGFINTSPTICRLIISRLRKYL